MIVLVVWAVTQGGSSGATLPGFTVAYGQGTVANSDSILASDKSLASRASLSGMARGYIGTRELGIRNGERRTLTLFGAANFGETLSLPPARAHDYFRLPSLPQQI